MAWPTSGTVRIQTCLIPKVIIIIFLIHLMASRQGKDSKCLLSIYLFKALYEAL